MFLNDSAVLTKYWAEIWWNPQNKTFQGSHCLWELSSSQDGSMAPWCPIWPTWLLASSFPLFKKVPNDVWFTPHYKAPRWAQYQHPSMWICISSEKHNSPSFQATSALLEAIKTGNMQKWRFFFLLHPNAHRKGRQRFAQMALLLRWPQSRWRKTSLGRRQFRFLTGSLLTIPQNSQPQTAESLPRGLCCVSDSGTANSTRQSLIQKWRPQPCTRSNKMSRRKSGSESQAEWIIVQKYQKKKKKGYTIL